MNPLFWSGEWFLLFYAGWSSPRSWRFADPAGKASRDRETARGSSARASSSSVTADQSDYASAVSSVG
jgi:hypothetical protein